MESDKAILHCDCNNYFASCEIALNPGLGEYPIAVCGDPKARHGIVLAKNEKAKKYGVCTAETVVSALKKCPSLVLVKPHYDEYVRISKEVNGIYKRYTDLVEPFGIDESFLDVTGSRYLFGDAKDIANKIRESVKEEVGITISVGVSFNKVFAKLGSDYKKPDCVTVIDRENYKNILYGLPATDMMYVGKRTGQRLAEIGIKTIGDIAKANDRLLEIKFGKNGLKMKASALGLDDSGVESCYFERDNKSIGCGMTFKRDIENTATSSLAVTFLVNEVSSRLRKNGFCAKGVGISVTYSDFTGVQKQRKLSSYKNLSCEIIEEVKSLLRTVWDERTPIRAMSVTCFELVKIDTIPVQMSFFDDFDLVAKREKAQNLELSVDKIKARYGRFSIVPASLINSDVGIYERFEGGRDEGMFITKPIYAVT